jgi:nucleoside-diphosphate-sugar epimerase
MPAMKALFIGGTGIISTACSRLAAERGFDLTVLTRGRHTPEMPAGVTTLKADVNDPGLRDRLAGKDFDVVVDWNAYTAADIERDLQLFRGKTRQFIFISSASAYQKPVSHYLVTESTPLANPYWDYSRGKIACEDRLMRAYREEGFPVTIVRPSLTYGDTVVPLVVNSWAHKSYTAVDRMVRGRKVIVPGDGTSLWVLTHNTDFAKGFVGLMGCEAAIGHAFHITSDEVLTWDQIYHTVGVALGIEPKIVHIPTDFITACVPEMRGGLQGDKSASVVFDNTKIKRFVPGYCATTPFAHGIRRTLAWFQAEPSRMQIDEEANAEWDRVIAAYERGLAAAICG